MKLEFKRDELLSAINIVIKAVSSKTTMPILECILIDASENGVFLTANDTEIGIETKVQQCNILEGGRIALEAKLFSEIIRKISDEDESGVLLNSDGNIVRIDCGNSTFRIQEMDADLFPNLPQIEHDDYITLSQYTLREMIRDTIFSVSQNDSNQMMTGELFEVNDNKLKLVSLDGHRISIRNTTLKESYHPIRSIIPGKTLTEISKLLSADMEKEVVIFFSQSYVLFRFDDTYLVSTVIDGEYFKIDSMLSSDYETKVIVNRKSFLECIERSAVLLRESDKKPLIMKIGDNTMSLVLNSVIGSMDASLLIRSEGKDMMIGFNPRFLMDALRVIEDEDVYLYMTNSKSPCFIRDEEENYIYLILPVNFNPAAYE